MVPMRPSPRLYLVRVIVDVGAGGVRIVTAYRTTRIGRYWRMP